MYKRPGIFRRVKKDASDSKSSASRKEAASSKLEGLPTEMIEEIIKYLPPKSLKAFRLSSKTCNSKSLKQFSSVCFENLHLLTCHEKSVDNAVKAAQHPVFGASIRSLEVAVIALPHPQHPHVYQQWDGVTLNAAQLGHLHTLCEQQIRMLTSGRFETLIKLLVDILKRQGQLRQISLPQVDIKNDTRVSVLRQAGLMYWEGKLAYLGGGEVYDMMLSIVLEAIVAAAINPDRMILDHLGYQPLYYHAEKGTLIPHLQHAISNIRCIGISLHNPRHHIGGAYVDFCNDFASTLAKSNVQTLGLKIGFDREYCERLRSNTLDWRRCTMEDADITKAVFKQKLPLLKALTLQGPSVRLLHLSYFVARQPKLRVVRCKHVKFMGTQKDLEELQENVAVTMEDCFFEDS